MCQRSPVTFHQHQQPEPQHPGYFMLPLVQNMYMPTLLKQNRQLEGAKHQNCRFWERKEEQTKNENTLKEIKLSK